MNVNRDVRSQKETDEMYMDHALKLALKGQGMTTPNPMVGAVIIKNGRIIGEGYHAKAGERHAEVVAIENAIEVVTGATLYVTLEPCSHYGKTPPCTELIIEKDIERVVIAVLDPNPMVAGRGVKRLRECGISVTVGVLEKQAQRLNEVFMKYIVTKRPFVVYKSAMSLDGKIATSTGESQWITCEESRKDSHSLRHIYTGIMVGIGTVLADDPLLNCRMDGGKQPVRIVVDSSLRIPEESRLVQTADTYPLIVATTSKGNEAKKRRLRAYGANVWNMPSDEQGRVDLPGLMKCLGENEVDSLIIEGGGTLAEQALNVGIVDKMIVYIAPQIIGGKDAKTPVEGKGIQCLSDAWKLQEWSSQMMGTDLKVSGYIRKER
ncbi:MAG: bifunctional diaminohydroxyphosphoribosylaminopyrimidine deaminase/5-amino-6-(5-phosphoribosylamino)uracil reductase RibD [Lachnospiraceae bacterium]|nr:bifunctional diaminohydroxyphosphoribosylaminopyrimidine deaminase/5-amino-6-(5-phosphoribosylamino)uracil reductase RibD [Lachnospiraceae bacterium]